MHRLFLLRAYGDFVILLQAIIQSPHKNKYTFIASKHLQPLYQELTSVIDISGIQIQFIDFGIKHTQLGLFTNKHLLSFTTFKELKKIKNFINQNPNIEGQDYIEQDKKIGLFNFFTSHKFKYIISNEPVYKSYAQFFENKLENIDPYLITPQKILIFPDTRQAKKNIPKEVIKRIENNLTTKGYTIEISYFKNIPASNSTNYEFVNSKQLVYNNFKNLIQLIQQSDFILGADSLPIHIAYLLKKPHYILYPKGYTQQFITPYAQINDRFGNFGTNNLDFL